MKKRQIFLARHGTTGERYQGRFVGSTDVPLAAEGEVESRELAQRIGTRFQPDECWCSPLQRTRQTAAIVSETLGGITVTCVEELREIDFGRWEGLSFNEMAANDPDLVAEWTANPENFKFPGGEKIAEFRARVRSVAKRFAAMDDDVLVIAHGGVIRAMLCHYLGLAMGNYVVFDAQPARLAVVTLFEERGVLSGFNL